MVRFPNRTAFLYEPGFLGLRNAAPTASTVHWNVGYTQLTGFEVFR